MKKRSLTMADIAERAGVAPMTVSRAMNGSGYVAAETKQRVMDAVRESNYRPSQVARSLRSQKTNTVGLLLPDLVSPLSVELARAMEEALASRGYACLISIASTFDDQGFDGLVVAAPDAAIPESPGRPVVMVGRRAESGDVDCVTADHWTGGFDATTHLIQHGHKRIAFIGASLASGASLERFQGFLAALREYGLKIPAGYFDPADDVPTGSAEADGYRNFVRLMTLDPQPTAVFARDDYTAIGAIRAAHDLEMRVPGDVSVIGFENIALSRYVTPALTTVDPSTTEQAKLATDLLLDRLTGGYRGERREVTLECRLIVRKSV